MHIKSSCLLIAASLAAAHVAQADVLNGNPSNYRSLLSSMQPGDTLQLASGTYTQGLPISSRAGTAQAPLIIQGPPDQSAVFIGRSCCNTVQLDTVAYVEIRNLTLDGQDIAGPFGVDSRGNSHHVTLENLRIVNHGGSQATVGISTKGPAWNWVIRRNTIIGAGTGMYLGNSDGNHQFVAGIIENNAILDTIGYNIEIKHQNPRPTGIGMPTGQSRTLIRHNVFSKANGAAGGGNARPNLLVGHWPLSGAGTTDLYEIYGNFFYQNPVEVLFQGEGNIALHDNVFVNDFGTAVDIQPHNDVPRNVTVYHNTVVATGNGIQITGAASGTTQSIVGNAVFAGSPLSGPGQSNNITDTYAAANTYLVNPMGAIGSLDLFPETGRLGGTAINLGPFGGFTDGTKDFDGRTRAGQFRGAYEGEGTNNGWRLALSVKPTPGGPAVPSVGITATPSTVALQGSSTLNWSASNATDCTASGGWAGTKAATGSEQVGPLSATTDYTLTCVGPGGTGSGTARVTVTGGTPAPTVDLQANPTSVTSGGSTQLTWTSTGATSCAASGSWSGSKALNGSEMRNNITAASTFTLSCTGTGGTISDTASVTVAGAPTVSLSANPTTVQAGGSSTLTWSSTNATGCTADGGWAGNKSASGSQSVGPLATSTTFGLTCNGSGGSATQSVQVLVSGGTEPPSEDSGGGGPVDSLLLLALASATLRAARGARV
jgi:hypothetical protein